MILLHFDLTLLNYCALKDFHVKFVGQEKKGKKKEKRRMKEGSWKIGHNECLH